MRPFLLLLPCILLSVTGVVYDNNYDVYDGTDVVESYNNYDVDEVEDYGIYEDDDSTDYFKSDYTDSSHDAYYTLDTYKRKGSYGWTDQQGSSAEDYIDYDTVTPDYSGQESQTYGSEDQEPKEYSDTYYDQIDHDYDAYRSPDYAYTGYEPVDYGYDGYGSTDHAYTGYEPTEYGYGAYKPIGYEYSDYKQDGYGYNGYEPTHMGYNNYDLRDHGLRGNQRFDYGYDMYQPMEYGKPSYQPMYDGHMEYPHPIGYGHRNLYQEQVAKRYDDVPPKHGYIQGYRHPDTTYGFGGNHNFYDGYDQFYNKHGMVDTRGPYSESHKPYVPDYYGMYDSYDKSKFGEYESYPLTQYKGSEKGEYQNIDDYNQRYDKYLPYEDMNDQPGKTQPYKMDDYDQSYTIHEENHEKANKKGEKRVHYKNKQSRKKVTSNYDRYGKDQSSLDYAPHEKKSVVKYDNNDWKTKYQPYGKMRLPEIGMKSVDEQDDYFSKKPGSKYGGYKKQEKGKLPHRKNKMREDDYDDGYDEAWNSKNYDWEPKHGDKADNEDYRGKYDYEDKEKGFFKSPDVNGYKEQADYGDGYGEAYGGAEEQSYDHLLKDKDQLDAELLKDARYHLKSGFKGRGNFVGIGSQEVGSKYEQVTSFHHGGSIDQHGNKKIHYGSYDTKGTVKNYGQQHSRKELMMEGQMKASGLGDDYDNGYAKSRFVGKKSEPENGDQREGYARKGDSKRSRHSGRQKTQAYDKY